MHLHLYEVITWGGDGNTDIIFLVSATSVDEAAQLADERLNNMVMDPEVPGYAETVCEIAPDPRSGNPVVILGPCHELAYGYGWKSWTRSGADQPWVSDPSGS